MAEKQVIEAELADVEAQEARLGVKKAVLKALATCGSEPPGEGGGFEEWSACLYRELRPPEPVAEANGSAKGSKVAELSKAVDESEPERSKVAAAANGKLHPGEPEASEPSKAPESSKAAAEPELVAAAEPEAEVPAKVTGAKLEVEAELVAVGAEPEAVPASELKPWPKGISW